MKRENRELLARLVMGMSPPDDWQQRFDDEGFDSYQSHDPTAPGERFVVVHPTAGVTVRMTTFGGAPDRPDGYPDGWPHVAHEEAILIESEGDGVDDRSMAWVDPREPETLWHALRRAFADDGWCEGPPATPPDGQRWVAIREAIALWRHPEHDRFRTLAWYDVSLPGRTVFIGLSDARAYRGDRTDGPDRASD